MLGWVGNIERTTLENGTFRTVVYTGEHAQLTVMRLRPGEDIGREAHTATDQFIRIERGRARVEFGRAEGRIDETYDVEDDWAIVIPAGVWHNVVNTGTQDLKLYSLYSPLEHPAGTIHRTKTEAEEAERASKR
jgi:mannose-6-phosphate isomerase-like protein (cupin superfamily)